MIEIKNIHKSFGDLNVLNGVSIEVEDGQSLVVMGKSGQGKSVLLKLITRLLYPDAGNIYIDGDDLGSLNSKRLSECRLKFGMLFQSAALFDSLNICDNVGIGLKAYNRYSDAEIQSVTQESLERVGLVDVGDKYPAQLSGGMRKRVGLARVVAMKPKYILYDEPTTGLDPVTSAQIAILIKEMQDDLNVTSIIVTHDIPTGFFLADKIVLLDQGNFSFVGNVEEMRKSEMKSVQDFISGYKEEADIKFR
ncbi:MAG: ATP-binding cassette domain-containing protein [Candidatus Marinimicrobia bacterium]|jgi:phospholipid/cholesterol/gamma-HCH transport system ATP-binding protein|nr:ATP-binding cassette domain-containing protein [Candidatus Neomarinimicrobiota bacterium]MBT3630316.1 ATP-binding cassette domain-containing protein [Candidatus Neomarinimicrobiota bacterium]MBT3824068.1 ATP-binding cassette domain-containing protein [Candidatus Neomarinimicrobiota bacterium]MBT4132355.1 ATP-binding cassette domain-containing protein [Candidatus Neomarinimicrobiota bacterium]MBT4296374.1 ATP-binding cassette domain-containing protein [Candidatus Neomarinimicrobiota bacterium